MDAFKDIAAALATRQELHFTGNLLLDCADQQIFFSCDEPELCLERGQEHDYQAKIKCSAEILSQILKKELLPQEADLQGALSFEGERDIIYKFWKATREV